MIDSAFTVTRADLMAAFAAVGITPTVGPLAGPVSAGTPGVTAPRTALDRRLLEVLANPARIFTATTVTAGVDGVGITRILAPANGGPYVAVASATDGWSIAPIETAPEAAVVLASHLGLAVPAPRGRAATLDAGAWSLLVALADHPEARSAAGLKRGLGKTRGPVAQLAGVVGPVDPAFPADPAAALRTLAIAGVVAMRDDTLALTTQGTEVVAALSGYAVAGSLTVDHVAGGVTRRVAFTTYLRSASRLFVGSWSAPGGVPTVALGEPGATLAAAALATQMATAVSAGAAPVAAVSGRKRRADRGADTAGSVSAVTTVPPPPPPSPPASPAGMPPPPAPPSAPRPAWFNLALGGGAIAVVALVLFVSGAFESDDPEAATTSTTVAATTAATTTTSATTTTVAPTTTGATTTSAETTTTVGETFVINDTFEPGAGSTAQPLFGEAFMTLTFLDNGRPLIRSVGPGVLPMMYPVSVGDADVAFAFRPILANDGSGVAAVILADDPSDGGMDSYVLVSVLPGSNVITAQAFIGGVFTEPVVATITPEMDFVVGEGFFNTLAMTIVGGRVDVSLNGVFALTWDDTPPATSGFVGWTLLAVGADDAMVVDDFVVGER